MILLAGKTCSGKNVIQQELAKMGIEPVVTYTTRPPRKGEVDGSTYHFVTNDEFLAKEQSGFFAETTSYRVANDDIWRYGSALEDLTYDKSLIVNPDGLRRIRRVKSIIPITFYIIVDENVIWNRLRQRGDNAAEARRRLNADEVDFVGIDEYIDFAIRNEDLTPKQVAEMIFYLYRQLLERRGCAIS